jgi:hypothetical protein
MNYRVVMSSEYGDFVEKVNAALADGWTLQGGVNVRTKEVVPDLQRAVYYQALTKEEE